MTTLTPEQKEYKQHTLAQLQVNLPLLEARLNHETRSDIANSLRAQLEDTQNHIALLQHELAANTVGAPVADELFQRVAAALTKRKFFLARRLVIKLETIEPFYPGLDRLRLDVDDSRASRRTQAIAQGNLPPVRPANPETAADVPSSHPAARAEIAVEEAPKKGLAQFFQFHIIISCLLVMLILCVMGSVGGVMLLQWLIEGR